MKRLATFGALLLICLACDRNKAKQSDAERGDKAGAAAEAESENAVVDEAEDKIDEEE